MNKFFSVLYLDDDPVNCSSLQLVFRKLQVESSFGCFSNSDHFIRQIEYEKNIWNRTTKKKILLICDDIYLHNESYQTVLFLKNEPVIKRLPIIILGNDVQGVEKAYNTGINSFILRPEENKILQTEFEIILHYWIKIVEPPVMD